MISEDIYHDPAAALYQDAAMQEQQTTNGGDVEMEDAEMEAVVNITGERNKVLIKCYDSFFYAQFP